jgi:peptidoglycan/xylan/chitin deacetylase (PgdA/CDA1 family)
MSRAAVVTYHAVGECSSDDDPYELFISAERFEAQMAWLARHRAVVSLADIVRGTHPRGRSSVAITFDDGYRNVLQVAVPIMRRYGLTATMFVPTNYIGGTNSWLEPSSCDFDIMTADEIKELDSLGVSVESHGHGHLDYAQTSAAEVRADVMTSNDVLEETLGRRPRYLAYPFGTYSDEAASAVASCGIEGAFSLERPHRGPFGIERVWVRPRYGLGVFRLKTSGLWSASWRWSAPGRAVAWVARNAMARTRRKS